MCGMETGAKRANVAVALAEADRARIVLANNDRIAGTPPVEVPSAGLVKAIYLRAQCLVRCSCNCALPRLFSLTGAGRSYVAARLRTRSGNVRKRI